MLKMRTLTKSYKIMTGVHRHGNTLRCFGSTIGLRSVAAEEKIEIPKKINRGPTDILHALSATVGTDTTAAHYKYHDDPYLIPMSNISKRTFAMAQEAGRKAAKWIRQEHNELFQVRRNSSVYVSQ